LSDPGPTPSIPYLHLYVDVRRVRHQDKVRTHRVPLKGVGPADPQWNDKMDRGEATVVFTVQPVHSVGE
jgi:hypothetical protein